MSNLAEQLTYEENVENCWDVGNLDYFRRNTQRKLREFTLSTRSHSRKCYWETTRRLGKSSEMLAGFTENCRKNQNWKSGFFAPVKDGLLDYIEPIIYKTYADCPEHLKPVLDKQRFLLRFPGNSVIIFRGANNQQHRIRRGQDFNEAGIDEAREVDDLDDLIDSVIMPALFTSNGYLIISSTPADTRSHPLFSIRQRAKAEGWLIQITMEEAHKSDPEVYTRGRIDEWKVETLKAVDGQEIWEREYECKWVINKNRMAIPEWDSAKMVMPLVHDPYYQFYHHYIGIDWGYKDFTALIFATYNFRKARLEVDGELTYQGKDVRSDLISEKIDLQQMHLWGKDFTMWRQVSDSADPILINELNKFKGMNFVPVEKAHTLEAMLHEFRILVSQGKIVVSPTCQMLIHDLETAVWTEKRDKLDKDIFAHHFDHLMALVYLTRVLDQNTNPIPRDFMVDGVRVVEVNFDLKNGATNESGKALANAFGRNR